MKTISTPGAALGGYEYRITRGGLDNAVYNIGERSPGAKRFKVIATVDRNRDDARLIVFIIEADLSGDPAQYLRAARRIRTAKALGYEAIEGLPR